MNSDSELFSNDLLASVQYPDAVDSNDRVFYAYNRQGQITQTTDQNGTVHEYRYDKLGRRTADVVTTLGTGISGGVRRVEWTYDSRGLTQSVTSYNAPAGGGIVNQVTYEYNHFQQLTRESQSHSGAVT